MRTAIEVGSWNVKESPTCSIFCIRNITYRTSDGRFCVIDFEFATLLDDEGKAEEDDAREES